MPEVELQVIASGTHLSQRYGMTVQEIEADGIPISARVPLGGEGAGPRQIGMAMGGAVERFARVFSQLEPELLVLLGDRYETLGAALALLPFAKPIAHIAGGEITEGAIDDSIRHALTKLSHLHFVATEQYARRVVQMGEEAWRVTVSGAPTLDNIASIPNISDQELEDRIGLKLSSDLLLATFHPVTLEASDAKLQIAEFLAGLGATGCPVVFTFPNADAHAEEIILAIREFVAARTDARSLVTNLGTPAYFALMRRVAAMVGNSSSGIIEAASFGLPVVNVGIRQKGRAHGPNVVHCECDRQLIETAIRTALGESIRTIARQSPNPYGDGNAAGRIVSVLTSIPIDSKLLRKRFCLL